MMSTADPLRRVPRARADVIMEKIRRRIENPSRNFTTREEYFQYEQLMYRRLKRVDRWWYDGFGPYKSTG